MQARIAPNVRLNTCAGIRVWRATLYVAGAHRGCRIEGRLQFMLRCTLVRAAESAERSAFPHCGSPLTYFNDVLAHVANR